MINDNDKQLTELALEAYQALCDNDYGNQNIERNWYAFEEKHGTIESGSIEEDLIFSAIEFGMKYMQLHLSNEEYDKQQAQ